MKTDRRCFVQWFVLALSYATIAFFGYRYGLPQLIFATDITYMTSAIAAIFALTVLYLGVASWRNGFSGRVADAGLGSKAAYIVTLFGLLGTVIGLQMQVGAMASVTPDQVMTFLAQVSVALGTAFYATGCGIVASIGIIVMVANLEYFIDCDE